MKRKFTKTAAALALLAALFIPLGMRGQTTATISSFTAISGNIDANISYAAFKGNGTTEPVINGTTLRIYKPASNQSTGGYVTITAASGCEMTSVTITNSNDKAGTIKYSVDGGSLSSAISLAKEASHTVNNITASTVTFYNCGTDRLSIAGFSVDYTSGGSQPTTYNVNLTQTTGGTISANPATAAAGTTVTLTATPDNGYSFDSWSISPSTVTITNNQFTMPASDVTVSDLPLRR